MHLRWNGAAEPERSIRYRLPEEIAMHVDKITLSEEERALWEEPGTRGDAFREGVRQEAGERMRIGGAKVAIVDVNGGEVEALFPPGVDPRGATAKRD